LCSKETCFARFSAESKRAFPAADTPSFLTSPRRHPSRATRWALPSSCSSTSTRSRGRMPA
jgi:hypothetical protein